MAGNTTIKVYEQIDVRYGYYVMCGAILFFQIFNKVFTFFRKPEPIHPLDFWRWRNLLCSWAHALITGSVTLWSMYTYPDLFDDPLSFVQPIPYALVAFSTGYFLYDTGDMIMANELLPNWEVVLHHIAVTSMFFYNTVKCTCIGYNIQALLAEVNSFFLHTRKLLQMLRVDFNCPLYRVNAIVNLFTFALCRGFSLSIILWGIFSPGERERVSFTYFISLCSAEFVMLIINPILFWRLVKNDLLRSPKDANSCMDDTVKPAQHNGFDTANNNLKNGLKRFNLSEKDD